jgi:hypothetical protein
LQSDNSGQHVKLVNWIMDSIGINNLFFFLNYCLFNYMITKMNDRKIESQTNTEIFFKDYDNLIKSKMKQIIKLDSQLVQY